MKSQSLFFLFVILVANLHGQTGYRDAPVGLDPVHIRITWTSDPQTSAVISWSTGESGHLNAVWYSTEPIEGALQDGNFRKVDAQRNGAFSLSAEGLAQAYSKAKEKDESVTREAIIEQFMRIHYHHAILDNLQPDTRYHFRVTTDGHKSSDFYFRTAPDKDAEFKVLAGGDSRSGLEDRI